MKESLEQEIRYKALISEEEENLDLSYVFGKQVEKEIKVPHSDKEVEKEIYFNLLKEDKLELFEIYLNIKRELAVFGKSNSSNYSIIKNYQLMKSFEKWSGSLLFEKITKTLVSDIETV